MAVISRKEAREILAGLLFETEFHQGEDVNAIFALAVEDREIPNDEYISNSSSRISLRLPFKFMVILPFLCIPIFHPLY